MGGTVLLIFTLWGANASGTATTGIWFDNAARCKAYAERVLKTARKNDAASVACISPKKSERMLKHYGAQHSSSLEGGWQTMEPKP